MIAVTYEPDYEKTWREFWLPIIGKDNAVDMDQVKRELHDYHVLLDAVEKVYYEVTDGIASKPNTDPQAVIDIFHERFERRDGCER